jgi:hypothetical protein
MILSARILCARLRFTIRMYRMPRSWLRMTRRRRFMLYWHLSGTLVIIDEHGAITFKPF